MVLDTDTVRTRAHRRRLRQLFLARGADGAFSQPAPQGQGEDRKRKRQRTSEREAPHFAELVFWAHQLCYSQKKCSPSGRPPSCRPTFSSRRAARTSCRACRSRRRVTRRGRFSARARPMYPRSPPRSRPQPPLSLKLGLAAPRPSRSRQASGRRRSRGRPSPTRRHGWVLTPANRAPPHEHRQPDDRHIDVPPEEERYRRWRQ